MSDSYDDAKGKRSTLKKPWSQEEDQQLLNLVAIYGTVNWGKISEELQCRSGKQCRERYHNHLLDNIKKGDWTTEEDRIIMEMQLKIGNQWAKITKMLPGRTDNAVKNRWHATMRSKNRSGSVSESPISGPFTRSHPLVPTLSLGAVQESGSTTSLSGTDREDLLALSTDHSHEHTLMTSQHIDALSASDTGRSWHSLQCTPRFPFNDGFIFSARPEGITFTARSDGFTFTARSTDENIADLRKFLELWDSENAALTARKNGQSEELDVNNVLSPKRNREEFENVLRKLDISPRFDVDYFQSNKRHRGQAIDNTPNDDGLLTGRSFCLTPASKTSTTFFFDGKMIKEDPDLFGNISARSLT